MAGIIVHEWLEPRGGAEKVVDAMIEAFPDSELVALWNDAPEKYRSVHESWLAHTPLRYHKAVSIPLLPPTWRHIVSPSEDVSFAVVSSHLFAHHVDVKNCRGEKLPKYVYAHTPARYIWEPNLDPRGHYPFARAASTVLRPLDRLRAQEAEKIAANSEFVRQRIARAWHRDSDVIYPPVDVEGIQSVPDWRDKLSIQEQDQISALPQGFLLGASRLISYKRLDWVISAGNTLRVPVVIAGSGPEEQALRRLSREIGAKTTFIIRPSTPMLYALYQQARAFVFPAVEDFGIMPVEAVAAGCPVIVNKKGGAAESLSRTRGGCALDMDRQGSRSTLLRTLEDMDSHNRKVSQRCARQFDTRAFEKRLIEWVGENGYEHTQH